MIVIRHRVPWTKMIDCHGGYQMASSLCIGTFSQAAAWEYPQWLVWAALHHINVNIAVRSLSLRSMFLCDAFAPFLFIRLMPSVHCQLLPYEWHYDIARACVIIDIIINDFLNNAMIHFLSFICRAYYTMPLHFAITVAIYSFCALFQ